VFNLRDYKNIGELNDNIGVRDEQIVLDGLWRERDGLAKFEKEVQKTFETLEEKIQLMSTDIVTMSATLQNRMSNMFLNVINNIKK
jgi:hypothetical protein